MKVKLINPSWVDKSLWGVKAFRLPPLNLASVAGLTPADIDIEIIDQNINRINYDTDADLIGITAMTPLAPKAYEIADRFRERGTPVALGGIHPSMMPNEAKKHADSVIIGEGECSWKIVLEDVKKSSLKDTYRCEEHPSLDSLPLPRRDLLDKKSYITKNTVQISRGCPFSCDFCSVSSFFGNTYRFKPIEDVIDEIKSLDKYIFNDVIFFVDDNIIGNVQYAKQLFKKLKELNIKWVSQSSINLANDEELLKFAADSGCIGMFIGFESLNSLNIQSMGKKQNKVETYKDAIKKIHDYGIGIEGAFIFGFDNDDKFIFRKTLDFAYETDLEVVQFSILTPFPGTKHYYNLLSKNRIFETDWSKYDASNVVFKPKNMTVEELEDGFYASYHEYYSKKSIIRRILSTRRSTLFFSMFNMGFKQVANLLPKKKIPK